MDCSVTLNGENKMGLHQEFQGIKKQGQVLRWTCWEFICGELKHLSVSLAVGRTLNRLSQSQASELGGSERHTEWLGVELEDVTS